MRQESNSLLRIGQIAARFRVSHAQVRWAIRVARIKPAVKDHARLYLYGPAQVKRIRAELKRIASKRGKP